MVLSFDPCDVEAHEIPRDAKFQTGPVYWLRGEERPEDLSRGESCYLTYSDPDPDVESRFSELNSNSSSLARLDDEADVGCSTEMESEPTGREVVVATTNNHDASRGSEVQTETKTSFVVARTESRHAPENVSSSGSVLEGRDEELADRDVLNEIQRERDLIDVRQRELEAQQRALEAQQLGLKERLRQLEERERERKLPVINASCTQVDNGESEGRK